MMLMLVERGPFYVIEQALSHKTVDIISHMLR